jgi:hypothetical protein
MSDDLVRDALAAHRAKTRRLLGFSQQQPPEPATPPSREPGTTPPPSPPPGKIPAGPRGGTSPSGDFVRDKIGRRARR